VQKSEKDFQAKTLHTRIVDEIRERIVAGDLVAGDRLPSEVQIAQQHHTSRGTVRHALNVLVNEGLLERVQGSGTFVRLSPLTRERSGIQAAQKSIGIILSQANDELNMGILRGVEQAARPRGYQVSFTYTEESTEEQERNVARLAASASGLIIFPVSNQSYDNAIAQLQQENFPFVLVDRYLSDLDCDYVTSDNLGGGYRATEHLLILGHTRIGFAYSPSGGLLTTSVRDRWEGYHKALQEYHQPFDESLVYYLSSHADDTSTMSFDDFVTSLHRPRAIFSANDSIALEIFQAAARHGLRVPEDIALVGFDDVSFAAHLSTPLTTVAQQSVEMGMHAGILLLNRIEQQISGPPRHIELPTNLIIRQSCGARLRVASGTPHGDE
jgi:GntR family transcriptional regulator of arabinose operon